MMESIDLLAAILVVVGALNWGLARLFGSDLVATVFGQATIPSRIVYVLVGVSGAFQAVQWKAIQQRWTGQPAMAA